MNFAPTRPFHPPSSHAWPIFTLRTLRAYVPAALDFTGSRIHSSAHETDGRHATCITLDLSLLATPRPYAIRRLGVCEDSYSAGYVRCSILGFWPMSLFSSYILFLQITSDSASNYKICELGRRCTSRVINLSGTCSFAEHRLSARP